jgi:DNA polymerase elongation subunit (family B)
MLSYSAEWYDSHRRVTRTLFDLPDYKPGCGDRKLALEVWKLLDEADIVVAHNGANFDVKKLNARFIAHGMRPPSPYKVVDTKREVKKVAAFSSNKLDWLCNQLEIGAKLEKPDGFQMWLDCIAGDEKAWKRMKEYNSHDIDLLRDLYQDIAPWITQPNAAVWSKDGACCVNPACGSTRIHWRGKAKNRTMEYERFQCQDCGKWGRAVLKGKRAATVVGIDA